MAAHVGRSKESADARSRRLYAFEPFDDNADLLERSIHENHFQDRVTFRRAAVGAASGTAMTFPNETLNTGGAARLLRDDRPVVLSELHPTQLDRAPAEALVSIVLLPM